MNTTLSDRSRTRRGLRWFAPLAAIAVVAAGTFGAGALAEAEPGLPPRTAEELVADVLTAQVPGHSGTVETTAQLGLPDLAALGGEASGPLASELVTWLSGTHTLRVWQSGTDKHRVSVPDGANEYGVYRTGDVTWLWSSADNAATKVTGTSDAEQPGRPDRRAGETPPTPQQAAAELLAAVGEYSTVDVAANVTVAGRSAYTLSVTPAQQGTKVGRIDISVDGESKWPLRVQVYPVGAAEPAVSVGYTDVDFTVPEDSVFAFTPPPGTTVKEKSLDDDSDPRHRGPGPNERTDDPGTRTGDEPTVIGEGWQTVVAAEGPAEVLADPMARQLLAGLQPVNGAWGNGWLFDGPLFAAVITDDGRVAAGAVVPERLYQALS